MKSLTGRVRQLRNAAAPADRPPVPYAARGRTGWTGIDFQTQRDPEAYLRTFTTNGTVFAIVSLLASSVAAPEWRMYRKPKQDGRVRYTTGDRGSDQRVEVTTHAALSLWNRPNPFFTGSEFIESFSQHLELTGEAYWIVVRDQRSTIPTGLWHVRPDRMEPVPDPDVYLKGWIYTGPSGEKVPLGIDEVIPLRTPNPLDSYRGTGPVQSILTDIEAARYAAEWNRNFFINSARPDGVVTVPNSLTDEQFDEMSARWREAHQGASRAHRVAFLEYGATWAPTGASLKDMDFGALRNLSRDVLREAWRVHKTMLGNSDDVNRANAQTAEDVHGRWQTIPRLNRVRMVANERYLPMFGSTGDNVELDYINPLPDDRQADNDELTAKTNAWAVLVQAGADPDDAAEVVGLPSMRTVSAPQAAADPTADDPAGTDPNTPPAAQDAPAARARERITARGPAVRADGQTAAPAPPDLSTVDQQWQQQLTQTTQQYQTTILPVQQQQLGDDIAAAIAAGTIATLGILTVSTTAAASLLLAALSAMSTTAAHTAAIEGGRAGVPLTPAVLTHEELEQIAQVTADLMGRDLATSAGREALRIYAPGMSGQDVADQVLAFLAALSPIGVSGPIGAALHGVITKTRLITFRTAPEDTPGHLYATEVMDSATCDPCEQIDGHYFGTTDDPDAIARATSAYPNGHYLLCKGRDRCRGTLHITADAPTRGLRSSPSADATGQVLDRVDVLSLLRQMWQDGMPRTPQPVAHTNGHDRAGAAA